MRGTAAELARNELTVRRFTLSAATDDGAVTPNHRFEQWFAERATRTDFTVNRVPFARLDGWAFAPDTGALAHRSGRFFSVEGLHVQPDGDAPSWQQPILVQREIGILGFLVREIDGVLHFLAQAKAEPGTPGGLRLSPTVQATRSNYTGVHNGRSIPYVEHFLRPAADRVLVDSLQAERSAWFLRKRNRHMVVEVTEDLPLGEDFCWLTLGQLRRLMPRDNLLSMETCSVLACLPVRPEPWQLAPGPESDFRHALRRSLDPDAPSRHELGEVISRLTAVKARYEVGQRTIPLREVAGWRRLDDEISRPDGKYFTIIGAEVVAASREVTHWTQPLLAPAPGGMSALFTRSIDGVLHVLLEAQVEAGSLDVAEFRPTVQCTPSNHADRPAHLRPRFVDMALATPPERIRFDTVMCEEGARFHNAENRYLIIEVGEDFPTDTPPGFTWVTLAQLHQLLAHSYYLNMQARTLVALAHALW